MTHQLDKLARTLSFSYRVFAPLDYCLLTLTCHPSAWNQFVAREDIYPILDGIDLQGQTISSMIFTEVSMQKCNLSRSVISQSDFSRANLKYSYFIDSTISRVNFSGSDLRNTCFINCKLDKVNFAGANLQGADFKRSFIRKSTFVDANLEQVDLSGIALESSDFSSANMCFAMVKVSSVVLNKPYPQKRYLDAIIDANKLKVINEEKNYQDFSLTIEQQKAIVGNNSNFRNTILQNADLSSDNNCQTILICCDFEKADLTNANFNGSNLRYCRLSGAILDNTNFLGTNLEGADLSETDFYLANVDASTNTDKAIGL